MAFKWFMNSQNSQVNRMAKIIVRFTRMKYMQSQYKLCVRMVDAGVSYLYQGMLQEIQKLSTFPPQLFSLILCYKPMICWVDQ